MGSFCQNEGGRVKRVKSAISLAFIEIVSQKDGFALDSGGWGESRGGGMDELCQERQAGLEDKGQEFMGHIGLMGRMAGMDRSLRA